MKHWHRLSVYQGILLITLGFICFTSLFVKLNNLVDPYVTSKWLLSLVQCCALIIIYCCFKLFGIYHLLENRIFLCMFGIFLFPLSLLAIQGIFEYFTNQSLAYGVRANFDNPAGFASALSIGFPISLFFLKDKNWVIKFVSLIVSLLIAISIILSGSRAGLLSILGVILFWCYQNRLFKFNRKVTIFLLVILFSTVLILYLIKRKSADGRLLIWYCSCMMIAKKPLLGFGIHGFSQYYMNFQADFFKTHKHSRFINLASNINQPFNEYLLLLVNFGILGFLLFSLLCYLILKKYRSSITPESSISLLCLASIAIFSFFSYPLVYPFTWIVITFCLFVLFFQHTKPQKDKRFERIICISLILLNVLAGYSMIKNFEAQLKWFKTNNAVTYNSKKAVLISYQQLWSQLHNNYYFLYNVAAVLNSYALYKQSLVIANLAAKKCADYDLQLIIADDFYQLKDYNNAELCYCSASNMCPNRFGPLYQLFILYKTTGRFINAQRIANIIRFKAVKVPSPVIDSIKKEAISYLSHFGKKK